MRQPTRTFRLSDEVGAGVACNASGAFADEIRLVDRPLEGDPWRARPLAELNAELSGRYGISIDISSKSGSLNAIARALNDGDVVRAQLATLHLRLPPAPDHQTSPDQVAWIQSRLEADGLLAKSFDAARHPRWPARSPGSIGGRFAPTGVAADFIDAGTQPRAAASQRSVQPASHLRAPANAPMDAGNRDLADALNDLRSGDGSRSLYVDGVHMRMSRSGADVRLTVDFLYTLHGIYSTPQNDSELDIRNVRLMSGVPGQSFQVVPDTPGGPTNLTAEIRVDTQAVDYAQDGTPVLKSVVAVRFNHTIALNGRPKWWRGQLYGIWHWGGL